MFGTALAETGPRQPEDITLAIITTLEEPCPEATLYEMRLELAEVLDPVGLRLVWQSAEEWPDGMLVNRLVSVRFRGKCLAGERWSLPMASQDLGVTHIVDGEMTSYCEVRCEAVRKAAGPLLFTEGALREPVLLGRALARVLAHEIYHVLSGSRHHGRQGVAKRSLTADELVRERLHFDEAEITTLRNRTAVRSLANRAPGAFLRGYVSK